MNSQKPMIIVIGVFIACTLQIVGVLWWYSEQMSAEEAAKPKGPKSGEVRLLPCDDPTKVVVEQYRDYAGWVPIAGKEFDRRSAEWVLENQYSAPKSAR